MAELASQISNGTTSKIECKMEGDILYAIQNGEVIGKLHFSLGIQNQGIRYAKVDFIITSNFRHSDFENPAEIEKYYSRHLMNLVIRGERIPGIAQRLFNELIQYLKKNNFTHIYLEPDSGGKQVYWRDKIGKKLMDSGKIRRYYGREEICFEL